jgi:lipopolysaccharide transport system permease protein
MDLILEPGRAEKNYWRDLWRYRELFIILAWRDVTVRYKQTVIGVAWAVIRPLLTTIVFTVVFSKIAKLPAPGAIPYALLVMAANLPWQFFATAMSEASGSLIGNANLISKIYFPRLIIPAGSVITSFVDFLITLGLMALLMVWYRFAPDSRLLALPLFMFLAFGASFGIGLWLCALNVEYRDFRYIVPFIVQFGFFLSPVGFSTTRVPEHWLWHGFDIPARLIYSLNPMVGVIDGFRWSLLRGQSPLDPTTVSLSVITVVLLSASGIWYFRKMERTFADVI